MDVIEMKQNSEATDCSQLELHCCSLSHTLSLFQLSAAAAVSFPPPSQHPPVQDYLLITPDFLYDVFVGCDRLRAYRCQSKRTLLQ